MKEQLKQPQKKAFSQFAVPSAPGKAKEGYAGKLPPEKHLTGLPEAAMEQYLKAGDLNALDKWQEISEVARELNVSIKTVKKWLQKRWLAYSKIEKLSFINRADLVEMFTRFRVPAEPAAPSSLHMHSDQGA